jgi:hypothetical protein
MTRPTGRKAAKSKIKRDIFAKLAAHYSVLAGELETETARAGGSILAATSLCLRTAGPRR